MPFVVALCIAVVAMPAAGAVGRRLRLVDHPGELKIHRGSIPLTGGLAVAAAVAVGAALAGWRSLAPFLGAAGLSLVVGSIDDRRPLSVSIRLVAQVVAALVIAYVLPLPPPQPVYAFMVVVLVTACANGVNLVDGQDGLAGGVAAIAAPGLALVVGHTSPLGGLLIALAGALAGFVVWNRPPARIFLGNGGAYFVGTLLGAGAASALVGEGIAGVVAAGTCLGVFAFEVLFSVARRVGSATALLGGDRLHSYDLLALHHDRNRVTRWFWAAAAGLGAIGVSVAGASPPLAVAVAGALAGGGAWIGRLLWSMRPREERHAAPVPSVELRNERPNEDA